jgi:adenylate cyclase
VNARLERKLRTLAAVILVGTIAGLAINFAQGRTTPASMMVGAVYGFLLCIATGGVELFVLDGPMRDWLGDLSFTASLIVRSAIYAMIIMLIQMFQSGEAIVGLPGDTSSQNFWFGFIYSAVVSVAVNLGFGIANIIGPRALQNFIYRAISFSRRGEPFCAFVDIAGSTGLAERLGGVGIHRFLDRTFRLLTLVVVDYRGEVLNYVGDEVIVTWRESSGAIEGRPLQCFMAMREALAQASSRFESEFGAVLKIRGSLHFGPVIVGEIGDVKRAIVFNGDVMNTAARLEELSRKVDGGFLASRAAMERSSSTPRVATCDLGRMAIRGRADGIDVVGIDVPAQT